RFDVTRGQNSGGDQIYWQTYNVTKGANGAFSLKLDQQNITALQIEAEDHLPAIVSLGTNGETHFDVELKKGSGPKGIVHTPDGHPAAGAQLAVLVRGRSVNVGVGKIANYGGNDSKAVVANTNGAFTLRFHTNADKIVATHARGYAETSFSNFVSGSVLRLQPWGTIEGLLKIGPQPGTNQSVLLSGDGGVQFSLEDFKTTTDERGRFFMASVPPGERRLVRLIPIGDRGNRGWGYSHIQSITVKTGETTTVTMGGNGRIVVGKLTVSDPSHAMDWRQSGHHTLSYYPKPPPFKGLDEYRAWENLPETIAARKNIRSYTLQVQEDGTFRVDDVVAGTYDLRVQLRDASNNAPGFQNTIGTLTTNVVVPALLDAPAAPVLDLGTFVVPLNSGPQQRSAGLR
ncbi:MAG TPA: hypothetical protein VK846_01115, partial [Candidatus Limnocylindria bacterium]|nr:hypothetical protein [Candidatus Limnocylindria bacterium]